MSFNCLMHERNIYKDRPDFIKIAADYPEFKKYGLPDRKGKFRIDFNDPNALRTLTKILLKKDFDLNVEIPDGYLIPTVPQRLNYILWVEDLLTVLPRENKIVSGVDIGTGPCAILSLLGSKKNSWHFMSTETSDEAIQWAKKNIENNHLESYIKVAKVNKGSVLQDAMLENQVNFDFCVCNPPFFENKDDIRKKSSRMKERLDLFAKKEEIFSDGGEVSFVKQLLKDSLMFKNRIGLYSSMFGKKKSFIEILKELQNVEGITYTKTEFCQGNTIRWGIAWTFIKDVNFQKIERPKPKKIKKPKTPLVLSITRNKKDGSILFLQEVLKRIKSTLLELQIQTKVIKSVGNYAELEILSYENTWSHQRRKRRKEQKDIVHEVNKKIDGKDENFTSSSNNKSNLNDAMLEEQVPNSSKNKLHSNISCTDLEQGQSAKNEMKFGLLLEIKAEQGAIQKTKEDAGSLITCKEVDSPDSIQDLQPQKRKRDEYEPVPSGNVDIITHQDDEHAHQKNLDNSKSSQAKRMKISEDQPGDMQKPKEDTVSFNTEKKMETSDLLESLQDSVSQKRKRDEYEPALPGNSDPLPDQDNKSVQQKNLDNSTLPEAKKVKVSEYMTLSKENEIKIECGSSSKENMGFTQSDLIDTGTIPKIEQTENSDKTFKTEPLLYCILKLKTTKEIITLEMNCPPESNRETMYQVFQLFRNKFTQF